MQSLAALEAKLVASGENQISLNDTDARAMTSKPSTRSITLIVTHEVTNIGIDKEQLSSGSKSDGPE